MLCFPVFAGKLGCIFQVSLQQENVSLFNSELEVSEEKSFLNFAAALQAVPCKNWNADHCGPTLTCSTTDVHVNVSMNKKNHNYQATTTFLT